MAKRFSELGIHLDSERKIFNCEQVSISDILNTEIEVIDFLPDVKTKHGEGRYLVHFKHTDTGIEGKFFTNATSLKEILDKVKETEDALPFVTIIKAQKIGSGKMFQFT